jgi:hypothetical protein
MIEIKIIKGNYYVFKNDQVFSTSLGIHCAIQDYNKLTNGTYKVFSRGKYSSLIVNKELNYRII